MSDREDQFRTLYEQTRPRIVAYALRRTSSNEDAADIVAETFEIAWRRLDEVPSGQAGLLWLYVTARYVLANHGRRIRRRDDITARLADKLRGIPLRVEAIDEESIVMRSCLSALPADDREVLMLAGWEGMSATEVGRVLGCSSAAARIRLHRARARLKVEMGELGGPEKHTRGTGHTHEGDTDEGCTPEEVLEK
jgi:RNA polymerase sigma factor (sigma-70 family)